MNTLLAVACVAALGGCYESLEPQPQAAAPPPQQPVASDATAPGIDNTPRPGLSGAKRAADNTADRIEQEQRKLEEIMDEDE